MCSAPNTVNLIIDGNSITVPKGTTVYEATQKLGITIPIFCYQDRMPPFGACRVCLVEVENMPKLQTSCTLEATEGMVVKTQSAPSVEGRKAILEFLLINHPLDCPICDRGGECPLQEQALLYGPGTSRFFEEKRHFTKPLPLGPVLMLDRERCIVCARCTRFSDLISGDHALEFLDRGFKTEVGTPGGAPAESKFIGNTIMICPVGALTSQVYRFRARPWDNEPTNSSCTLCPVGCSMILDARDGEIMRTRSREDKNVNDIWMCDKGWFGYEFSSSLTRLNKPLIKKNGQFVDATYEEAFDLIALQWSKAKQSGKIAGWGGVPLTVEENYYFQKLFRVGAGCDHLDFRIGMPIVNSENNSGMEGSLQECEELNYAVLLGLDLTEEFPVIWLRLRQAINKGATVLFLGHYAPEIAPYLARTILHAPGKESETLTTYLPRIKEIASNGKKGAIYVGSQYLASFQRDQILNQLIDFKANVPNASINLMEGRGNSLGAHFAGMIPLNKGLNAIQVLETMNQSGWDFLYVAGANPALKYPSKIWKQARSQLKFLVVQDLFLTETAAQADVVLPTLSYVEKGGHFLNIERRLQSLAPGKEIPEGVLSDGEIFRLLAQKLKCNIEMEESFSSQLKNERLPYIPLKKQSRQAESISANNNQLAATFAYSLFDRGVRMKHNPHLLKLVHEPYVRMHAKEAKKRNLNDKDKIEIRSKESKIEAYLKIDSTVAEGTIVLPLGFEELPVVNLATNLLNGLLVEVEKSR